MNNAELANQNETETTQTPAPEQFEHRLAAIEETVQQIRELLLNQRRIKDWYTVAEVSDLLDRAEFTVREWCRLGRVHAAKQACGRGRSQEWMISHEELERIENAGLIPC